MKIVYDCDDVLWDFNGRICQKTGIPFENLTDFDIANNKGLTRQQIDAIINEFHDISNMQEIIWYPGIESIIQPMKDFGAEVIIKSNKLNKEAAMLQSAQLSDASGLPRDCIHMNIISVGQHKSKDIGPDIDIFIDDSPYNIRCSKARFNIMPRKPWNIIPEAVSMAVSHERSVIYMDTLQEISDFVYQIAKAEYEKGII